MLKGLTSIPHHCQQGIVPLDVSLRIRTIKRRRGTGKVRGVYMYTTFREYTHALCSKTGIREKILRILHMKTSFRMIVGFPSLCR